MLKPLLALPALLLLAAGPATDANHDGEISLGEEVMVFERLVAAADADADGFLDAEELFAFTKAKRDAQIVDEFLLFDVDSDGTLGLSEYQEARARTDPTVMMQAFLGGGPEFENEAEQQAAYMQRIERMQALTKRARERATVFLGLPPDYSPYQELSPDDEPQTGMNVEWLRYDLVMRFMMLDTNEDRTLTREEQLHTDLF